MRVEGQTVLVTGAAGGIGLGIAKAFLSAGSNVVLTDVDEVRLVATRGALAAGDRVSAVPLDVTSSTSWEDAAQAATSRFGSVDVLCLNAGLHAVGWDLDQLLPEVWDLVVRTNLTGAFLGIRAVLPAMKSSGNPGHIVITSSMAGVRGMAKNGAYVASKHALVGLADALRHELAGTRIGVSILVPGYVPSEINKTSERLRLEIGSEPGPDLEAATKRAAPRAVDALEVGGMVVDAVGSGQFFIVTHPEQGAEVAARSKELMAAFNNLDGGIHP
jgi:NAD(P)-dependent dehydrogenase (short-subunit alcohol dehydrogenase family)